MEKEQVMMFWGALAFTARVVGIVVSSLAINEGSIEFGVLVAHRFALSAYSISIMNLIVTSYYYSSGMSKDDQLELLCFSISNTFGKMGILLMNVASIVITTISLGQFSFVVPFIKSKVASYNDGALGVLIGSLLIDAIISSVGHYYAFMNNKPAKTVAMNSRFNAARTHYIDL